MSSIIWIFIALLWCPFKPSYSANRSPNNIKRVAVIGGGAAGYFSAIECARVLSLNSIPYEVVVFEASSTPLSKVKISGGGRCNVMHDPTKGSQQIAKGYPRGSKELLGPFNSHFGPDDTYAWFSKRGVVLKTEEDGRVFPNTDSSQTIIDTLQKEAKRFDVDVRSGTAVKGIQKLEGRDKDIGLNRFKVMYQLSESGSMKGESASNQEDFDRVVCATGSSRSFYKVLEELGHNVSPPLPSLFSFKIKDDSVDLINLSGISIENAQVKIQLSATQRNDPNIKKFIRPQAMSTYTQSGPLLFTHQGVSGPAVLRTSAFAAKLLHALNYSLNISVNFLPSHSRESIIEAFETERRNHPTRLVTKGFPYYYLRSDGTSIKEDDSGNTIISRRLWLQLLLKAGLIDALPDDAGYTEKNKISSSFQTATPITWERLTKTNLNTLANTLLEATYTVSGRGQYRDEFVTCGGVELKEVNFDRLESKVVSGLYLAGEVLDIDGITGGYNFQSAWSTGWIAGHNAALDIVAKCSKTYI